MGGPLVFEGRRAEGLTDSGRGAVVLESTIIQFRLNTPQYEIATFTTSYLVIVRLKTNTERVLTPRLAYESFSWRGIFRAIRYDNLLYTEFSSMLSALFVLYVGIASCLRFEVVPSVIISPGTRVPPA